MDDVNINKYNIKKNSTIIIGSSAGPDSMALLSILKNTKNYKLVCAHINHNVRKESIKEEEYLKKYCKENDIIFESRLITSYNENNFENEARNKRYSFYEKLLTKYNSNHLFLGHHGDDLIETVLMKITRGSNIEGYAGFREVSTLKNYTIIRPLIIYTKENILDYCKENNIKYFIDKSNKDEKYTRNRYRKNILPLLKKEDNLAHQKFLKFSKTLIEYSNYVDNQIDINIQKIYKDDIIDIKEYNKLDTFMRQNIIYRILEIIYNNKPNIIKEKHVTNIIKLIQSSKPNSSINLPLNINITKEYDKLIINKSKFQDKNYIYELQDINIFNEHIIKKEDSNENGNDICRLNYRDVSMPLYIRNRKDGDFIYLLGTEGRKKIKDIFIEKKVPLNERDNYPLLVDSNDTILWVPNLKKSKFLLRKNEKCDIILRYYEKEKNK